MFPISRDPPEGGTGPLPQWLGGVGSFQFLGIPPKGELVLGGFTAYPQGEFPISRDPPEGGTG